MELKGKVVQVCPLERGKSTDGRDWERSTLIVEYGNYPRKVAISAFRNAELFAQLPVGAEVTFYIDVESREYYGQWYASVICWKWELS